MLDLCSLGKENDPWGRDREIWGGDAQKDNSERAHGLSGRPGSFFRGKGIKVFFYAPNSAQDILELENKRKREKSLRFKELACTGYILKGLRIECQI